MPVTKSFKSGNSVAVRLPKAVGVQAGEAFDYVRRDDGVIELKPVLRLIDVSTFLPGVPGIAERWREYVASGGREFEDRELDWSAFNKKFGRS